MNDLSSHLFYVALGIFQDGTRDSFLDPMPCLPGQRCPRGQCFPTAPVSAVADWAIVINGHMSNLASGTNGPTVKLAVNDNTSADARAESNVNEVTNTSGGAEIELPQGSGIGVIDEKGLLAQPFLHYVFQGNVLPSWQIR